MCYPDFTAKWDQSDASNAWLGHGRRDAYGSEAIGGVHGQGGWLGAHTVRVVGVSRPPVRRMVR
jgi:hypothetical protein